MNWKEYRGLIQNTPYTDSLKYAPIVATLHPQMIPLGVIPSDGIDSTVIKIPEVAVNKYGNTVPVVAIGKDAFKGNSTITDIIVPSCVNAIHKRAFANCESLERITIPKAVTEIEEGTFANCRSLTDIYYEGSSDEWKEVKIVHFNREVELGEMTAGSLYAR